MLHKKTERRTYSTYMDEVCTAIRDKLANMGTVGKYIIVEEDDFFDVLPQDKQNTNVVDDAMKKLNEDGWIDLRYARGELFCLALLKVPTAENPMPLPPPPSPTFTPSWQQGALYAVAAALGGFLGSVLTGLF